MTQLALVNVDDDAEMVVRSVVLPYAAISKNVYDGWPIAWKSGHRKTWKKRLLEGFEEQQVPTGALRVACQATLVFPTARRRDFQNYVHPLWYYVADALVDYGAIPDDTPDYFSIGANGGIVFNVDNRKFAPESDRKRVVLGLALQCL